MNDYTQTEFILYVIALLANVTLLFVVLRYSLHKTANYLFAFFILSQIFWITVNYYSFTVESVDSLWVARLALFAATFHIFSFFWFIHSFLAKKNVLQLKIVIPSLLSLIIVATLTLSSSIFSHLELNENNLYVPQPGWGMPIFSIFIGSYTIFAGYSFIKKFRQSKGIEKVQWIYLAFGLLLTFLLVFSFSFINVVIFGDLSTVRFSHLYTLPFVILTAYAMIKHRLLNVKAVLVELTVLLLNLIIFIQLTNSENLNQFVVTLAVLLGTIFVGILQIRAVKREIEQREQLEKLTKDLKQANKKLKKLDEAKTEFLSITSHQLRTPLSSIKGYLSMMIEGDFGDFDKTQTDALNRVYGEVERLIRLVQVFLNVSRIESGRLRVARIAFDMHTLLDDVIKQLSTLADEKNISLTYDSGDTALEYVGDSDKLKDVFVNLVDNAIKYTPSGKIWVTAEKDTENLKIEVHDTGVGIEPEYAEHLFQKFSRAKGIAQINAGGSGLGLFIVKKIIEAHGGTIQAKSEGKGKGTTFSVVLPLTIPDQAVVETTSNNA